MVGPEKPKPKTVLAGVESEPLKKMVVVEVAPFVGVPQGMLKNFDSRLKIAEVVVVEAQAPVESRPTIVEVVVVEPVEPIE